MIEFLLAWMIIYLPVGNGGSINPLPISVWFILIPFAVFLMLAEEVRKVIVRKFHPRA